MLMRHQMFMSLSCGPVSAVHLLPPSWLPPCPHRCLGWLQKAHMALLFLPALLGCDDSCPHSGSPDFLPCGPRAILLAMHLLPPWNPCFLASPQFRVLLEPRSSRCASRTRVGIPGAARNLALSPAQNPHPSEVPGRWVPVSTPGCQTPLKKAVGSSKGCPRFAACVALRRHSFFSA